MRLHLLVSSAAALCATAIAPCSLTAQLPVDTAVVFELTPVVAPAYFRLVNVFGRGDTELRRQSVFLPITTIAIDPTDAQYFYYLGGPNSFAGTWQGEVNLLAEIGQNLWGPWSRTPATRVAVSDTRIVTILGTTMEVFDKVGNVPGQTFTIPDSVDVAIRGDLVYLVGAQPSASNNLVEFDLNTGTTRTVGTYANMTAVAISPLGAVLCIGTSAGEVLRVDIVTGAVNSIVAVGLNNITAVAYTRFGTVLYSDGLSLWSELAPSGSIYTSATAIIDFDVTLVETASVVPFGTGCGLGAAISWATPTAPTLGNAGFTLGLRDGPAATPAVFAAGANRTTWTGANVPLPFDLSAFGAPGCELLVSPDATALVTTDSTGAADQPLPIPSTPALLGVEFAGQWFVIDATIGPFALSASEAVAFVIG